MQAPPTGKSTSEVRVALAGLGTVGKAVAQLLQEESERYREELGVGVHVGCIFDRSFRGKDLSWLGNGAAVTDSLAEFMSFPADVVVEVLGGSHPAETIIRESLGQGRAVVTANKLLMARCGADLLALAAEHHASLGFEAAVAGGIPIIRALNNSLVADRIERVRGILNGTCNFILTEMASSGREFRDVLSQAQTLGYAERDPSLDVSGRDACDKLVILSALCFDLWVPAERVPIRGITDVRPIDFLYAQKLNTTIKLLGVAERRGEGLFLRVSPFLVDDLLPLSQVNDVLNAVEVTGARLGPTVFSGQGAGGAPTAVSVVADVLNAALHPGPQRLKAPARLNRHPAELSFDGEEYPFYIRFFVKDRPGIIAALSRILADRNININSVLQEKWPDPTNLPFIVTVESTPYAAMQEAVAEMSRLEFNCVPPLFVPMLVA